MSRFSDLNILSLCLDAGGCGHYRNMLPMRLLQKWGADVHVVHSYREGFELHNLNLYQYDYALCQRTARVEYLDLLMRVKQETGLTLILEVDDNLHQVHPESYAYKFFYPGSPMVKGVEKFMRAADGMIVSTPDLAGQYAHFNSRILMIPNYIDFTLRDWDGPVTRHPALEDKVVIGWAGSHTHQEDQEPLRGVLADVLKKYDNVVFACCSSPFMMQWFIERLGLPREKVVCLNPVPFMEYPIVPAQFDIGIAPLKDSTFNRAKSDLKLKEYLARGVPYIASDISPYRRFHTATYGVGGYLAGGSRDWRECLEALIEDEADRKRRGQAGKQLLREEYALEDHIDEWANAFRACKRGEAASKWASLEKPGRNQPCPCGSGLKTKRCCKGAFG